MTTVDRKYLYKAFRNGQYLGLIPNVTSDFSYSQDINTPGTITTMQVAQSLDTAGESVGILATESGVMLTTENGIPITTERSPELIGNTDSGRLIVTGNDIEVWEFSDNHLNGILKFSGYISKWRNHLETEADMTEITVVSYGKDLSDYVYGNSAYTLQTSQTTADTWLDLAYDAISTGHAVTRAVQTFSSLSFDLTKIAVSLAAGNEDAPAGSTPVNVTLRFYSGDPMGSYTLLQTVNSTITTAYPSFSYVDFVFNSAITLSNGTQYFYAITASDYMAASLNSSSVYANGSAYYGFSGYSAPAQVSAPTYDFTFKLYSGTLLTDAVFAAYDPSQMVRDALTGYASQGGQVTYTGSSITSTGYSYNSSFITATPLEIIQKARDLAPADWYWYVDPGSQVLYFKAAPTTATHRFIKGKHLNQLLTEASIEEIVNVVYFTGGPTAGVNLLKLYTDLASLSTNRRGMQRLSDNRVTSATEASALSTSYMAEHDSELFRGDPIRIMADTYDISSINLGEAVSVAGFGSFIDSLVLQITRVSFTPDYVDLTLGPLPLKSEKYIDDIKHGLDNQQTVDNPNTPS